MRASFELLILSGPLSGRRIRVPEAGLRVGRASANDLSIASEELSRIHCLFEWDDAKDLCVVDLASANGTFVNDEQITCPTKLKLTDCVRLGDTIIKVVEESARGKLDLGLAAPEKTRENNFAKNSALKRPTAKRSPLANFLWFFLAMIIASAIAFIIYLPRETMSRVLHFAKTDEAEITELEYEKVEADSSRIFRYYLTVSSDNMLRVICDDVPTASRHIDKKIELTARAKARIREIFASDSWRNLETTYSGARTADENVLKSWRIRVIRGADVREILVENTPEPEAFKLVREALETFSRNELGIWAIQYSHEQLLALSRESAKIGEAKWDERDVEYGNLSASIDAYREAIFYLDTVNPKPDNYDALRHARDRAIHELDTRYREQRFLADKAINLAKWDEARAELRILCDLVPNKNDARHAEANAKLIDVEKRLQKSRKGN